MVTCSRGVGQACYHQYRSLGYEGRGMTAASYLNPITTYLPKESFL